MTKISVTFEIDDTKLRSCSDSHLIPPPAGGRCPVIVEERGDLTGHTISVERVDRATARAWIGIVRDGWEALIGRRAVVERHDGRLGKVCAIQGVHGITADEIEYAAAGTARTYGARHVPAG